MDALKNSKQGTASFDNVWVGSDLPFKLKENTYLLFSPYYEKWSIGSIPSVQSLCFPIGLIMPLNKSKWSITTLPMFRWNGEKLFEENSFQYAAVAFTTYAKKPNQKFRLGIYASKEFFGWFIIPLIGTDWKINANNHLFGLLPGRLTYEHKWNEKVYTGFTFRAPMNSYRIDNTKQYMRLDDNQLSLYLDYYLAKHLCFTIESGMGVFRKIKIGNDNNTSPSTEINWGDSPFVKISASYRIRL
jgi:hypothetical protein